MGKYPRTRANRLLILPQPEAVPPIVLSMPQVDTPCEYAEKFTEFADVVLETLKTTTQSLHVNRAKILVTDQYFRIRRTLPIYHQDTTNYNNHPCIYQAWVAAYEKLILKELEVAPPAFEIPPKPAPQSRKKPPPPPPNMLDPELIHRLIMEGE